MRYCHIIVEEKEWFWIWPGQGREWIWRVTSHGQNASSRSVDRSISQSINQPNNNPTPIGQKNGKETIVYKLRSLPKGRKSRKACKIQGMKRVEKDNFISHCQKSQKCKVFRIQIYLQKCNKQTQMSWSDLCMSTAKNLSLCYYSLLKANSKKRTWERGWNNNLEAKL